MDVPEPAAKKAKKASHALICLFDFALTIFFYTTREWKPGNRYGSSHTEQHAKPSLMKC
jgi:hypothetical protein